MTTQHTPGRALLDEDEPIVRGEDGERIANCYRLFDGDPAKTPEETGMANARRLVAAWNACEGISTHALEVVVGMGASVGDKIEALETSERELMAQRDELLAALNMLKAWDFGAAVVTAEDEKRMDGVAAFARAAIAKAEGGAK